jgi:hypothetical protein
VRVPTIRQALAVTFLPVHGVPVIVSRANYDLAVLWATVIATPPEIGPNTLPGNDQLEPFLPKFIAAVRKRAG